MTFSVLVTPRAAKSLRKLQRSLSTRIIESLKEVGESPELGDQLKPSKFWKIRVADYRIIYEIDITSNRVIVLFVGHRKNVYDEFSRML